MRHGRILTGILLSIFAGGLWGETGKAGEAPAIIPLPAELKLNGEERFTLDAGTVITITGNKQAGQRVAVMLAEKIKQLTALELTVAETATSQKKIVLNLASGGKATESEEYTLKIGKDSIDISAPEPAGLFYGTQSLLQIIAGEKYRTPKAALQLPALAISDNPRFPWRGFLLDCCRHYFKVDDLKKLIDLMGYYKLNRFHWHLTEDQGWRFPVEKFPKLTEVGAWRTEPDGSRYGGFYTRSEIDEVIRYAAERAITVVPEIELPGHSQAALAAYPELGCTGGPYQVANGWGVFQEVFCAGNDAVFLFLGDILNEVAGTFPGRYLHVGGDECPKVRWKQCEKCQKRMKENNVKDEKALQGYFIKRISDNFKSKILIGWDEVLEGGVPGEVIVQSWRGYEGGIEAVGKGHQVIMSPHLWCYVNYPHSLISFNKAYSFEPVPPSFNADETKKVLGLELCLWTEQVSDLNRIYHQVFPRLCAYAEVGWTCKEKKEWKGFLKRMEPQLQYLAERGVAFGNDPQDTDLNIFQKIGQWSPVDIPDANSNTREWDITAQVKKPGSYEVAFNFVGGQSALNISEAAILENGTPVATDVHEGRAGVLSSANLYHLPVTSVKADAKYTLRAKIAGKGGSISNGEVRIHHFPQIWQNIGGWKAGSVSKTPAALELDISKQVDGAGRYIVTLTYTGGNHALLISGVTLFKDGAVVSADNHKGETGGSHNANSYAFNLQSYDKNAKYSIKAMISGKGGTDSNGVVRFMKSANQ